MSETPPPAVADALRTLDVSRETIDRLACYVHELRTWQRAINLVGPATLDDAWRRHVLDCAQLLRWLPSRQAMIADMGSGAGLPGMILALCGCTRVHLIESDQRKAAFLRHVARVCDITPMFHVKRLEALGTLQADIVTARALAPLEHLLGYAAPLLAAHGHGLFLKGARAQSELTTARQRWHITVTQHPSLSDPAGVILDIAEIHPV